MNVDMSLNKETKSNLCCACLGRNLDDDIESECYRSFIPVYTSQLKGGVGHRTPPPQKKLSDWATLSYTYIKKRFSKKSQKKILHELNTHTHTHTHMCMCIYSSGYDYRLQWNFSAFYRISPENKIAINESSETGLLYCHLMVDKEQQMIKQ